MIFFFMLLGEKKKITFLCSLPPSLWYCCVDVSVSRQMLVTGDNVGNLILLGLDGKKVRGQTLVWWSTSTRFSEC